MGFPKSWVNYVEGELTKTPTELVYCSPQIDARIHRSAQSRIYSHPMTNEYSKKWNLPICSQNRFGQICPRVKEAIHKIQYSDEGWHRKDDVMRFSNALIESWSHVNAWFRTLILGWRGWFPIVVLKRWCIPQTSRAPIFEGNDGSDSW